MVNTKENYSTGFDTIQDALDGVEQTSGGVLYQNPLTWMPPVDNADNLAGPGENIACYDEKVTLSDQTTVLQGHGVSSFIAYSGSDHTLTVSGSDCWVRDMWIDSQDATGVYDAVNVSAPEVFLENLDVDGAGRYAIHVGGAGVERCRIVGCQIQGTASQSSNQIGIHFADSENHSVISGTILNANVGGSIHDEGFGNTYAAVKALNGGSGFNIAGNMMSGASLTAFSTNNNGFEFRGSESAWSSVVSRGNDSNGCILTGSTQNVQGTFSNNAADGMDISGTSNLITATCYNNANDGVEVVSDFNLMTAVTQNNSVGVDLRGDYNVVMANSYNNSVNQLNCNTTVDYNVMYGLYAKSSGGGDPVYYQGRNSAFFGLVKGGQARVRNTNNAFFGNFQDGIRAESSSDGSCFFGNVQGTLTYDSNQDSKIFSQYGEHKRISTYSSNATLTLGEDYITADTTLAGFTLTLPAANSASGFARGKEYRIKNTGTGGNNLTVQGETFADGETAVFVSDGSSWVNFS